MNIEEKTKIMEGKESGTSPEPTQLNSTPVPTTEEEENAGVITPEQEPHVDDTQLDELDTHEKNQPAPQVEAVTHEEDGVISGPASVTFTQSQVDEIVGKARKEARERLIKNLYDRYGVNGEEELDNLFADAQRYVTLKDDYDTYKKDTDKQLSDSHNELASIKEQMALYESGIDKERYDDAKLILKGKGLDVTVENIESELATHPEWKHMDADKQPEAFEKKELVGEELTHVPNPQPAPSTLEVLGNKGAGQGEQPDDAINSEYDRAMKLFKL